MKRQKTPRIQSDQAGFTIVELMVATLVFSVILLVITIGVIHFTNSYYKGINSSTTQNATQNALDTISQAVQFSATDSSAGELDASAPSGTFCAGTKLFLYDLGYQYTGAAVSMSNPKTWGLFMIDNPSLATCLKASALTPANVPNLNTKLSQGTQLLGKNMRLSDITMSEISAPTENQVWQISVRFVYGDADLLCRPSVTGTKGGCSPRAASYALTDSVAGDDVICKLQTGSQFCSTSVLSTIAEQRISN